MTTRKSPEDTNSRTLMCEGAVIEINPINCTFHQPVFCTLFGRSSRFRAALRGGRLRLLECLLLGFFCTLIRPAEAAYPYTVVFDAPPQLKQLLESTTDIALRRDDANVDASGFERLYEQARPQILETLRTEGYFNAEVAGTLTYLAKTQAPQAWFHIKAGAPVIVRAVDLQLVGPIQQDPDFTKRLKQLQQAWALPAGMRFQQLLWESSKKAALQAVSAAHYAASSVQNSRVIIDPVRQEARLSLTIDSGPAYVFGDVEITGLHRYPRSLVTTPLPFLPGDPYRADQLSAYQRVLQTQAQFSAVSVHVDPAYAAGHRLPVQVELEETLRYRFELGPRYSTDEGLSLHVGFDDYRFQNRPWLWSSTLNLAKREHKLDSRIAFPLNASGSSDRIDFMLKRASFEGVDTRGVRVGAARAFTRGALQKEYRFDYLIEQDTIEGVSGTRRARALIPAVEWTQRVVDAPHHPRNGYLWSTTLSVAARPLLSGANFVRVHAKAAYYWTPSRSRGTWLARAMFGQLFSTDSSQVPFSQLFRTGGSQSVRGYAYESLGIQKHKAVLPGRVMATLSLEYQHRVAENWAAALFADAGDASDRWRGFQFARAYGVGVRYFTPLTPLAFDWAYGQRDRKWRINLGVGLNF